MITDKFIHSRSKNDATYKMGSDLFNQGCVTRTNFEMQEFDTQDILKQPSASNHPNPARPVNSINSHNSRTPGTNRNSTKSSDGDQMKYRCIFQVDDGTKNTVTILADEKGDDISYSCSCSSFWATWGACKHIIAALKYISPQWESNTKDAFVQSQSDDSKKFFGSIQPILSEGMMDREGRISVHITPSLQCTKEADGNILIELDLTVGIDKQYLVKDLRQFLTQLEDSFIAGAKNTIEFSKLFVFDPGKMTFDYKSKQLIQLLRSYLIDENRLLSSKEHQKKAVVRTSLFDGRSFKIGNAGLASFYDIFQDEEIEIRYNQNKPAKILFSTREFPTLNDDPENGFGFFIQKYWKNHVQFQVKNELAYPLSIDYRYLLYRNTLYRINSRTAVLLQPLLAKFIETDNKPMIIAENDLQNFYTDIILPLKKRIGVYIDPSLQQNIEIIPLQGTIKINQDKNTLFVEAEFKYTQTDMGKTGVFDRSNENRIFQILEKFGFSQVGGNDQQLFSCSKEDQIYSFLTIGVKNLQEFCTIFYSESFKPMKRINASMMPQISFGLDGDLFEVSFEYRTLSFSDIQECLKSYKLKKNYYRLKTGEFLDLESKEFCEFSELIGGLGIKDKDIGEKPVILPLYRSMYLDQTISSFDSLQITKKESFVKLLNEMKENESSQTGVIPPSLDTILREYQKQGIIWLNRLHRFHFGGILADDMGLGKTLQVLAFIVAEKEKSHMPSLVVAPTSLVFNWEAEVQKFAPDIKTLLIHGGVAARDEKLLHISEADLVITSYALLRRDIAKYEDIQFRACIIDEAQNIKNPKTINSKSVKQVHAQTYFALTGTPIENSLSELWSIFDFLMPGYLFSHSKFQEQFEIPIFKDKDADAIAQLKRLVSPFILRRMKKDVLKELPEKINSVLYNEMTTEQAKLYASYILTAKSEFAKLVEDSSYLPKNRFAILSLLTRLRQICCHPAMFLSDYNGESGKLEQALELIQEALSGQHRILIFSQFTSMLDKLKDKLNNMSLDYFYLDGKTPVKDRKNIIDSFQAGERSLFLISLKAGGTGLNLTGADMVIHLDPWWNPAVEDQATDRVYRIGQMNRVQVFKLITKDTIEEKIYALQEKKNAFVKEMIQFDDESPIFSLNQDELLSLFDMT
ncbi:MAG: DEAD/DEAH box helicase [Saccharofermentanales bacterium]